MTNQRLSTKTKTITRMWIRSLGLTEDDKKIIINNDWLNDTIIDTAQTLICNQYPVAGDLDK